MNRLSYTASNQHASEHGPKALAVRTYRRIAEILAEREGTPVRPAHVKQICRAAERKITRALRADPVFHDLFGSSAARVH